MNLGMRQTAHSPKSEFCGRVHGGSRKRAVSSRPLADLIQDDVRCLIKGILIEEHHLEQPARRDIE